MVYDGRTMSTVTSLVLALRDRRRAEFNRVIRKHLARGENQPGAVLAARLELNRKRPREFCVVYSFGSRT